MRKGRVCLCIVLVSLGSSAASPSDGSGPVTVRSAASAVAQGQLLQSQGKLLEAENQFEAVLREATEMHGRPGLEVSALLNLANVEIDLAHTDTAARLFKRAIEVLQSTRGDHVSEIGNVRLRLAELYLESGATRTAEKLVDAVIASQRERASADMAATAYALDLLACVYADRKSFREAENSEREVLSILENQTGEKGSEYAIAALHMGSFLNSQKRPVEAMGYIQRALAVSRALPVREPALEGAEEMILASIYSLLGRNEEALSAVDVASAITQNYYGAGHPKTAAMLLAKAAVLRKIGHKADARQAQREGERIIAAHTGAGMLATVPVEALFPR